MLRKSLVSFLCLIFSVLLLPSVVNSADIADVVIIKSQDLGPFEVVEKALMEYLIDNIKSVNFNRLSMQNMDSSELESSIKAYNPDVICAIGSKAALFARSEFKGTPSVFSMVLDPKRVGLSPPGVSLHIPYNIKLQYIKKVLPGAQKIGVIYTSESEHFFEELNETAAVMGFELRAEKIDNPKGLLSSFKNMSSGIDCFVMLPDSRLYFPQSVKYLLKEGIKTEVPIFGLSSVYAKAGALLSLECDYEDISMQCALQTVDVLNGADIGQMKYAYPKKVKFSFNAAVAKQLGSKVSSDVQKEATEVFGL